MLDRLQKYLLTFLNAHLFSTARLGNIYIPNQQYRIH